MSVQNSQSGQSEKKAKHAVADTLADSSDAVAVVEREIDGEVVKDFYIGLKRGYVEILHNRPSADFIKRFTLCKHIDEVDNMHHEITITAKPLLDDGEQQLIEREVGQFLNKDPVTETRKTPERTHTPDKEKYGKEVVDNDPYEHFDIPSKAAGHSGVRSGGWD